MSLVNLAKANILKINIKVPFKEIERELKSVAHLSISDSEGAIDLNYSVIKYKGLTSLCLYGFHYNMTLPDSCYSKGEINGRKKHWCLQNQCPITTNFLLKSLPVTSLKGVRIQYLKPDGFLSPHIDASSDYLFNLNITVSNNDGFFFLYKNQDPWSPKAGDVRLIDVTTNHSVVNLSDQTRISIIVKAHHWDEEALLSLVDHTSN